MDLGKSANILQKSLDILEHQEVADGDRQGSVCGRMGRDRSESEPSDDTHVCVCVCGGVWEDLGISDFRGFPSETSF